MIFGSIFNLHLTLLPSSAISSGTSVFLHPSIDDILSVKVPSPAKLLSPKFTTVSMTSTCLLLKLKRSLGKSTVMSVRLTCLEILSAIEMPVDGLWGSGECPGRYTCHEARGQDRAEGEGDPPCGFDGGCHKLQGPLELELQSCPGLGWESFL